MVKTREGEGYFKRFFRIKEGIELATINPNTAPHPGIRIRFDDLAYMGTAIGVIFENAGLPELSFDDDPGDEFGAN